jgi:hypothetical protein
MIGLLGHAERVVAVVGGRGDGTSAEVDGELHGTHEHLREHGHDGRLLGRVADVVLQRRVQTARRPSVHWISDFLAHLDLQQNNAMRFIYSRSYQRC